MIRNIKTIVWFLLHVWGSFLLLISHERNHILLYNSNMCHWIPVAVRCKALVCGCSLAGNMRSNPAWVMDDCLL